MLATQPRFLLSLALLVLLPLAGRGQSTDEFFEIEFDGGWVGTIDMGSDQLLLQLNMNVAGSEAIGTIFSHSLDDTTFTTFAPSFGKIRSNQLAVSFEPVEDPAAPGAAGAAAAATTLSLSYEAASDTLEGKAKGETAGRVRLARMDPGKPLNRLWTGSVQAGGEEVAVRLQLEEIAGGGSGRQAVESVNGYAWVGADQGAIDGTRSGNAVELTLRLSSGDVPLSAKLKRKNSHLKGNLGLPGTPRLKLVPVGSNNGKPMKAKGVESDDIAAGSTGIATVKGRNFGLGALVHADDPAIEVLAVDLVSPKRLDVVVSASSTFTTSTEIALRVVNGDGQTEERSRAFTVVPEDGDGGGDPISFAADVQPIFSTSCAVAGCHSTGSAQAGLVLASGSAFANIVNVPSSQRPSLDRITPGDPDNSYLVNKIRGDAGIQGGRMPLNRTPLTSVQIDRIVAWVAAGASNNTPDR